MYPVYKIVINRYKQALTTINHIREVDGNKQQEHYFQ